MTPHHITCDNTHCQRLPRISRSPLCAVPQRIRPDRNTRDFGVLSCKSTGHLSRATDPCARLKHGSRICRRRRTSHRSPNARAVRHLANQRLAWPPDCSRPMRGDPFSERFRNRRGRSALRRRFVHGRDRQRRLRAPRIVRPRHLGDNVCWSNTAA
jgi:hypothetical protein